MIKQCGLALRNRLKNVMKAVSRGARFHRALFLARWRRSRCRRTTFIGITGSAGKTTAKELAALVLSTGGACQKSPGTSNEPVDVVKTIAKTTAQHRFCVVELSAHRPGSLDQPLRVLEPDIGVLMVVARDHFSAYKSTEGIAVEERDRQNGWVSNGPGVCNRLAQDSRPPAQTVSQGQEEVISFPFPSNFTRTNLPLRGSLAIWSTFCT